jgi:hypothetical protein
MVKNGFGYSLPPAVTITGGGGTGAAGVARIENGGVAGVVITNQGTGYTGDPTVSFASPSTSATVSAVTAGTGNVRLTLGATVAATTWGKVSVGGSSAPIIAWTSNTQLIVAATTVSTGAVTLYAGGAEANARAYTGSLRPISFFKGRYNDMYGVDGMGRGFRWNGKDASVERIGLSPPCLGPAISAQSSTAGGIISAIQIVNGGNGYSSVPKVTLTGGSPAKPATAVANISQGRVTVIVVQDSGSGYQSAPSVQFSGGIGSGAQLSVGVAGSVEGLDIVAGGSGYTTNAGLTASTDTIFLANHGLSSGNAVTFSSLSGGTALLANVGYYVVTASATTFSIGTTSTAAITFGSGITSGRAIIPPPVIVFSSSQGLTGANASAVINDAGQIMGVQLLAGGTGATSGVTASVTGGAGTGGQLRVGMVYGVQTVTATSGGSGYFVAPAITFLPAPSDTRGNGAAATAVVNTTGQITAVTVSAGGQYSAPPTAVVLDTQASAQATLMANSAGKYYCAIRYIDDTPESEGGPIGSSISDLVEIDATDGAASFTWTFAHPALDARVHAMELWRTSADQDVVMYRVATILRSDPVFSTSYEDVLSDAVLQDTYRDGYGLMPVTLPSGQINARRFEVPPGNYGLGVMFQDRAWFAVDTTGQKPNSLLYSEVDEPESVPLANELILQESGASPDKIVALVPLGSDLLVIQRAHLYKLSYVAQPVLDASIILAAYRGILNPQCADILGGVAFIVDSNGMYAFDGNAEEPLSVPIDNLWRDGTIDLTKSANFHVRSDFATRTVRFYYCRSGDSLPVRALCYCVATKSWWEETYPTAVTASCALVFNGKYGAIYGTATGDFVRPAGLKDLNDTAVPYTFRSGAFATADDNGSRAIGILYTPTGSTAQLNLGLHYNNSSQPRANAIAADRGSGFVVAVGSTVASLDMRASRSSLGSANGFARASFSGRVDPNSSGSDKHIAVAISGEQTADPITIYGIQAEGIQ